MGNSTTEAVLHLGTLQGGTTGEQEGSEAITKTPSQISHTNSSLTESLIKLNKE
jgi:hypothetical protein